MNPRYSILLCNQSIEEYESTIKEWLSSGIKVLWFSQDSETVEKLKAEHKAFAKAFLLQAFHVEIVDKVCIVDGEDLEDFVSKTLASACPLFNSAQYLVEHCKQDEHIIVQASAGTGKTTVMIDRILFLLHTQAKLHLSEVFMITFTNDATDQMNKRLQDTLMTRYNLTGQQKYLRWVEEQSQMNISTIHSFAYYMLKQYGIGESFTKSLSIRSFQFEKKELIKDIIDQQGVNKILKDYFPEEYGDRKILAYPIGQFVSTLNKMWDEELNTIKLDEDNLIDCFASGWLSVNGISGKQYMQDLMHILPFFQAA